MFDSKSRWRDESLVFCILPSVSGSRTFWTGIGISTCVPQNVLFAICVPFILQSRLKCIYQILTMTVRESGCEILLSAHGYFFLSFRNTSETHIRLIISAIKAVYPLVKDTAVMSNRQDITYNKQSGPSNVTGIFLQENIGLSMKSYWNYNYYFFTKVYLFFF